MLSDRLNALEYLHSKNWGGWKGRLKATSCFARRHASKSEHCLDIGAQLLMARVNLAVTAVAQQVHHHCGRERKQRRSIAVGVPVSVLVQLRVPRPNATRSRSTNAGGSVLAGLLACSAGW